MISFLPAVRLRPLGKNYELDKFNGIVKDMNSIDKMIAGVFYRFVLDGRCPVIFVRLPKKDEEILDGIVILKDFDQNYVKDIAFKVFDEASGLFRQERIECYTLGDNVLQFVKGDFEDGVWENYDYEISGVDGISIPR